MYFYVGLLLLVLVLLYITRWYWNAPKRSEPSGKVVLVTGAILNHFIQFAIIITTYRRRIWLRVPYDEAVGRERMLRNRS